MILTHLESSEKEATIIVSWEIWSKNRGAYPKRDNGTDRLQNITDCLQNSVERCEVLPQYVADWVDGGICHEYLLHVTCVCTVHVTMHWRWEPLFHLPPSHKVTSPSPAAEKERSLKGIKGVKEE